MGESTRSAACPSGGREHGDEGWFVAHLRHRASHRRPLSPPLTCRHYQDISVCPSSPSSRRSGSSTETPSLCSLFLARVASPTPSSFLVVAPSLHHSRSRSPSYVDLGRTHRREERGLSLLQLLNPEKLAVVIDIPSSSYLPGYSCIAGNCSGPTIPSPCYLLKSYWLMMFVLREETHHMCSINQKKYSSFP